MYASQAISRCAGCAAQAARNATLQQEITELQAEVARLHAQLQTLQAQLAQTSANSHKPPSSDPPTRARVRVRELSTRRRGGQPGHQGTTPQLRSVAEVDELHVCQPTHCRDCGSPLTGRNPSPLRHQVTELPPLQPLVQEYQLHRSPSFSFGSVVAAKWPRNWWAKFLPGL